MLSSGTRRGLSLALEQSLVKLEEKTYIRAGIRVVGPCQIGVMQANNVYPADSQERKKCNLIQRHRVERSRDAFHGIDFFPEYFDQYSHPGQEFCEDGVHNSC